MSENEKSSTDAQGEDIELDYDKKTSKGEIAVKVICLGDSAVGKSKWVFYWFLSEISFKNLKQNYALCKLKNWLKFALFSGWLTDTWSMDFPHRGCQLMPWICLDIGQNWMKKKS